MEGEDVFESVDGCCERMSFKPLAMMVVWRLRIVTAKSFRSLNPGSPSLKRTRNVGWASREAEARKEGATTSTTGTDGEGEGKRKRELGGERK